MKHFTFIIFLLLNSSLFGQNKLTVQLVTLEGEEILYGKVMIRAIERFAETDEVGQAILINIPAGKHQLDVTASGFKPYSKEITISASASQTITMIPEFQAIDEIVISGTMKEVSKKESTVNVEVYSPKFFKKIQALPFLMPCKTLTA